MSIFSGNIFDHDYLKSLHLAPLMILFSLWGVVCVYSASQGLYQSASLTYPIKQFCYLLSGLGVYCLGYYLCGQKLFLKIKVLWLFAFFLLLLPLSPLGKTINGASRWITLIPGLSLQLSEFVKVLWVVILALFSYNHHFAVQKKFKETLLFCGSLSIILILLLAQPDFGSSFVLTLMTIMTLFVAKVRLDFMIALALVASSMALYLITHASYRLVRLLAFLDPQAHASGPAYQLWQSLIAMSASQGTGLGLGQSWQKFQALPECHTDFIFAIMIEEIGFYGGLFFLTSYFFWIGLLFYQAAFLSAQKKFLAAYTYVGAACLFLVQLLVNVGVCLGLLPTKGLTLPFISYGGSSLWAFMFLVGILEGMKNKDTEL